MTANWVMAVLFIFAAAVQVNDPDPLSWIAIYLGAAAVCVIAARRRRAPVIAAAVVGAIAAAWGAVIARGVRDPRLYTFMFDAWEMRSPPIEEAREASGLLLVAASMGALLVHTWRSRS
jgi:hypothetical protein